MTNKEQLRDQFEKDKGVRCITNQGDGDIRYVEFLESEIEKMDKDYRHRIIQLLDKAIERDDYIKALESANKKGVCSMFCPEPNSTSATKCFVCGKEKIEHENQRG